MRILNNRFTSTLNICWSQIVVVDQILNRKTNTLLIVLVFNKPLRKLLALKQTYLMIMIPPVLHFLLSLRTK